MKTQITLILIVMLNLFQHPHVHAQVYMFQKTYGGSGTEYCYSIQATSDGGYIMAGETNGYGAGNYDGYLIKTNEQGVITWAKTYGDTAWDWLNSVRQTSDGGYIVTGGTESFGNGQGDIWILKTDVNGVIQWQRTSGGSGYDNGYDVRQTTDGGYIICGFQNDDVNFTDDACLVKTDASGNVTWAKTYSVGNDEYAYTVEQTSDGGYIIGGESYSNPGDAALIIKADASGNVQWAKTYGGANDYWVTRLMPANNGDYFVAGTASQPSYLNIWLARLSSSGVPIWSNSYAGTGTLEDNCIWATRTSDGGFALCGGTNSFTSDYESFLLKTDSTGGPEWTKRYGGTSNDNSSQVVQTADGGFILGSNSLSFGGGGSIYFIKTNASGSSTCNENIPAFIMSPMTTSFSTVTVIDSAVTNSGTSTAGYAAETITEAVQCLTVGTEELSADASEISVFPNPAANQLTIDNGKWTVENVEIYDVFGKRVYSVPPTTNNKQQTIDISSLAYGMYFIRIRTEKGEEVRKLVKK